MDQTIKITKRFPILLSIFLSVQFTAFSQDSLPKLTVVSSLTEYREQVRDDASRQMVELKSSIPSLVYDLRYATINNFTHTRLYPENLELTFLRSPAVAALKKVQENLSKRGYGLKIFDAYRPYAVTIHLWDLVKDERYTANPAKGSGHNRGIAIDLTIISVKTGKELDMGTGFDNFTDSAHHSFKKLPAKVLQNRKLLRSMMEKYGFKALETEWWHYYLVDGEKFEVMDIGFEKLKD